MATPSSEVEGESSRLIGVNVNMNGSGSTRWADENGEEEPGSTYWTVEDAVDALDWGPFHNKLLIQCGMAWACDAMEMMLLSFLVPRVVDFFMPDASPNAVKFYKFSIGAITFAGIWLGCIVFGRMSDRRGRRTAYFWCTAIVAVFGVLCSFAPNIYVLITLRFMVGVGLGGVTSAITLFSELVSSKYRGVTIILSIGALWTFGSLFETCVAWFAFSMPGNQWRLFLAISAVPSFALLCVFPWLVESPRYFMSRGMEEEALKVFRRAARENKKELPKNLRLIKPAQNKEAGQLKDLFTPKLRLTTVLLWGLWFLSVVSYYGLCFVTPLYFQMQHQNEFIVTLVAASAEFPGILACSLMVDRLGRKKTQIIMYAICAAFTYMLSFTSLSMGWLTLAATVARGSSEGAFNQLYVYTPEVYPTAVRNFSLGICSAVARVAGILVSYVSFASESGSQAAMAIRLYALAAFVSVVLSWLLPIETKGYRMDEEDDEDAKSKVLD